MLRAQVSHRRPLAAGDSLIIRSDDVTLRRNALIQAVLNSALIIPPSVGPPTTSRPPTTSCYLRKIGHLPNRLGRWWLEGVHNVFVSSNNDATEAEKTFPGQMDHIIHLLHYHVNEFINSQNVSVNDKQIWLQLKPMVDQIVSDLNVMPVHMKEKLSITLSDSFQTLRRLHHTKSSDSPEEVAACPDLAVCLKCVTQLTQTYPDGLTDAFLRTFVPIFDHPDFPLTLLTPLNTDVNPIALVNECREYLLNRLYLLQSVCQDLNQNQCELKLQAQINALFDYKYQQALIHFSPDGPSNPTSFNPDECAKLLLLQQETLRLGQTIQDVLRDLKFTFHTTTTTMTTTTPATVAVQPMAFIKDHLVEALNKVAAAAASFLNTVQTD